MFDKFKRKEKINKTGIKPQRSSVAQDPKARNLKTDNRLILSFMIVLNLVLTSILGVWVYSFSDNQFQAGKGILEKTILLEEKVNQAGSNLDESLEDYKMRFDNIDKEVRKLWDLSNKKNKNSIISLKGKMNESQEDLTKLTKKLDTIGAKFRAQNLEAKGLKNSLRVLQLEFEKINSSLSQQSLEDRINELESSVKAIDSSRTKINGFILKLRSRIDKIERENSNSN